MKTNFIPFGAFMQNDFTSLFLSSELPDEAALLGFSSSSLSDYAGDDEWEDEDLWMSRRPLNANTNFSTALRGFSTPEGRRNGGALMQHVALGYVFRRMATRGLTFKRLAARGVDQEIVDALYASFRFYVNQTRPSNRPSWMKTINKI
jgi:hypothetical protein